MNHIVSTLIAPNGVKVKLLGETHAKNKSEEQQCSVHINDHRVTDILYENAKISKISKFILPMIRNLIGFDETTSSITYARYFRNTRCKTQSLSLYPLSESEPLLFHQLNEQKQTTDRKDRKIRYHDLEEKDSPHIRDDLFSSILIPMLCLTPFANRYPKIRQYVFAPAVAYQFTNLAFSLLVPKTNLSYPTKSKISQWSACDTILYRRDKVMAQSIIEHAKNKIQDNPLDLSLCIFGIMHHEGICYYLQENGFTFFEKPMTF